ncbi:glycerophosphodiester phosphodiesterase family protein [Neptunomonas antarctica]|uniref:glycerophosphodiester phosphodiesterase n=1 Tax=Neptunomonas antarctica TaxID=619304 RepID=A0A1N7J532_9GAMM|nr:glycerophosphodiester phosphodiesterase family protein [Neptunomonas antarctica]SIS44458.1 glycerophosphoryl diester phosphodiesterase [Neptunomonas antarctica]
MRRLTIVSSLATPLATHFSIMLTAILSVSTLCQTVTAATDTRVTKTHEQNIQLGPRPYFLINEMAESALKDTLQSCAEGPFKRTDFSIGHRGAAMQFPEHTKESYEAAARMGAGVIECDVTFTQDKELVCRHSQCDLQSTTNILDTPLAENCSVPFQPAVFAADGTLTTPATAQCCTSDITLAEFKTLKGKMDASNPNASSAKAFMNATAAWRTDLYATHGTLMTHKDSISLFKKLGVKMTPELKSADVPMPFNGFSQQDYAQKMINEYKQAGIPASDVYAQSFNLDDLQYWIENEPDFAHQAVYLDGRYDDKTFDHRDPATWNPSMKQLVTQGVNIIAPPMWMLLEAKEGEIVPSDYAKAAKSAGLKIITWTLERSGPLVKGGGWYHQTLNGENSEHAVINSDGNTMHILDVLAKEVGILGIFSDWPATVTYYANCMDID